MRIVVLLTLGLGVCGPMLIHAEKIVFVVPRYVRRSYTGTATPFRIEGERSYKMRHSVRGGKRPYFTGHYSTGPITSEPFFHGEKHRAPQGGDDFDSGYFNSNQELVNHVVIPHGKGISHGISFGKGYIPHDQFNGDNQNYEFPVSDGNQVDYAEQDQQGDVGAFEDAAYAKFQGQEQGGGPRDSGWPFPANYEQETNQEEARFEVEDAYKSQGTSSPAKNEAFLPKLREAEESRAVPEENVSPAGIGANILPPGPPIAVPMVERKPTPIILQDTIDMKEYVEKIEAFAKSWPTAAALQGFGWKSQTLNPPALTTSNYQGFNSWSSNLPRTPTGSYQVQEDSVEEPSQRSFRTIMI